MVNERSIKAVFEGSLKLTPGESCLIVTDTGRESIGRSFYEYASKISDRTELMVIDPLPEHGCEPPAHVAGKMLDFDVELLITESSLTHTRARIKACEKGARIATMPMITETIANRCLDIDYDALRAVSRDLYGRIKGAGIIKVVTDIGTDMEFVIGESLFFGVNGGSYHAPGAYGNLPEGELAFAPETCKGVYLVDASMPGMGLLRSPMRITVENGRAVKIEGEKADELKARLDKAGSGAYVIAELGIGLNPKAEITGNVLEDEKVMGTVHIALGNNLSFGRDNDVPLHLDGVIKGPDISVDGEKIMAAGRFI